jgi:hypothetical protein
MPSENPQLVKMEDMGKTWKNKITESSFPWGVSDGDLWHPVICRDTHDTVAL